MNSNISELVFILDRSGSMSGLEGDTIGGFNSMIEKQKTVEGKCFVTTVLFDNDYERIHDRVDLGEIPQLTEKEYYHSQVPRIFVFAGEGQFVAVPVRGVPLPAVEQHDVDGVRLVEKRSPFFQGEDDILRAAAVVVGKEDLRLPLEFAHHRFAVSSPNRIPD